MGVNGIVRSIEGVEPRPIERSSGAFIQVLIGPEDRVRHVITRRFTLLKGGTIGLHKHPTVEHQQYVIKGRMRLQLGYESHEVSAGQAIYIPADTPHAYLNIGDEVAEFICMIPHTEGFKTIWLDD